jgi:hypothetical protein
MHEGGTIVRIIRISAKKGKVPPGVPKKNTGGDCYEAAARYIIDHALMGKEKGLVLVHGIVTGQGPIRGIQYGHAWVENGDEVIDKSRGRDIHLPKAVYYALGNISETIRYTPEETRRKLLDTGNYGPWDLKSEY